MYDALLKPHSIIKPIITDNGINNSKITFNRECMQLDSVPIRSNGIANVYIVYSLKSSVHNTNDPTIKNCLFGEVALTKNMDIDKFKYKGFGIGFDRRARFSFGNGTGQNVIIFGVNMSSSIHVDNKGKGILILEKGPTQGVGNSSLTAEKLYSINFAEFNKKFVLSLHYNGDNSYLFVNGVEIIKSKALTGNIKTHNGICLGNISKDWGISNMKATSLVGDVYEFSCSYVPISVNEIKNIHEYLMKKHNV